MKALVTGATGFIGSHLVGELIKRGYRVTCLVRKNSSLRWLEGLETSRILGDCEDEGSLGRLDRDFDYIFHLAGLTKAKKEEDFFCANKTGTENLLKVASARCQKLKRFLFLSSLAAVGPSKNGTPLTESAEPEPVSSYGKSKREGEIAVTQYRNAIPATILRPPAVYGPRDRDLFVFFKMIKRGFYPHWGKCYYSLLYVDDLVRGLIMSAEAREAEGGVYFLSDSRIYTNEDIVSEIGEVLETKAVRIRIPKPVMSILAEVSQKLSKEVSIISSDRVTDMKYSHWICDASKARKEFGFMPKVTIKEGIKWTADWYRIHQWL